MRRTRSPVKPRKKLVSAPEAGVSDRWLQWIQTALTSRLEVRRPSHSPRIRIRTARINASDYTCLRLLLRARVQFDPDYDTTARPAQ